MEYNPSSIPSQTSTGVDNACHFKPLPGLMMKFIELIHWPMAEISKFFMSVCQSPWWCHEMETFSVILALCAGNSPVTRALVLSSITLCPNKWLSKQSWGWWFETPLCSLWHHCNFITIFLLNRLWVWLYWSCSPFGKISIGSFNWSVLTPSHHNQCYVPWHNMLCASAGLNELIYCSQVIQGCPVLSVIITLGN